MEKRKKQESIEERKNRRKRDAVRGVLVFALIQIVTAAAFLACAWIPGMPRWVSWMFVGMALLCVLTLIPVIIVLRQRFQEIEGGEFDEASKY